MMADEVLAFTPRFHEEGRALRGLERHNHPAGWGARVPSHPMPRVASAPAPAPPSTIAVGRALGTVVVTVRGTITERDAPTLRAVLGDLINNQGNLDVVIDMRRLSSASPSGLAALAEAAEWAAERGASFRLSEPAPMLREKLKGLALAQAIEINALEGAQTPLTASEPPYRLREAAHRVVTQFGMAGIEGRARGRG